MGEDATQMGKDGTCIIGRELPSWPDAPAQRCLFLPPPQHSVACRVGSLYGDVLRLTLGRLTTRQRDRRPRLEVARGQNARAHLNSNTTSLRLALLEGPRQDALHRLLYNYFQQNITPLNPSRPQIQRFYPSTTTIEHRVSSFGGH